MKNKPIKRIFLSLLSVSLIIAAAGCTKTPETSGSVSETKVLAVTEEVRSTTEAAATEDTATEATEATTDKTLNGWVDGYAEAVVTYQTSKKQALVTIYDLPCQILYVNGKPSPNGEVKATDETNIEAEKWLKNKFGAALQSWGKINLVDGTGSLEKTGKTE